MDNLQGRIKKTLKEMGVSQEEAYSGQRKINPAEQARHCIVLELTHFGSSQMP